MPAFDIFIFKAYSDGTVIGPMRDGEARLTIAPADNPNVNLCGDAPTDAQGKVTVNVPQTWTADRSLLFTVRGLPPTWPGVALTGLYRYVAGGYGVPGSSDLRPATITLLGSLAPPQPEREPIPPPQPETLDGP